MCSIVFSKKSYLCGVNQLNFRFMSHKFSGSSSSKSECFGASFVPLYALFDMSIGDTLNALVTVHYDRDFVVALSGKMHTLHPEHHDYGVVRSTVMAYFGTMVTAVAKNGTLLED